MTLKTEDSWVVMQCVLLKSGKISKWAQIIRSRPF